MSDHIPNCPKRLKLQFASERTSSLSTSISRDTKSAHVKPENPEVVTARKFKTLPVTEIAQRAAFSEIEKSKSDIIQAQVILRALFDKIPDDKSASQIVKRDIAVVLNSPLVLEFVISLLGQTGAGKSKLISALLDKLDVTQSSSAGSACTHVRLQFGENPDKTYEGQSIFHYIDEKEFRIAIDVVYDALDDEVGFSESERGPVARVTAYSAKEEADFRTMMAEAKKVHSDDKMSRTFFADRVLDCGPRELLGTLEQAPYKSWQALRDSTKRKLAKLPHDKKVRWPILSRVRLLLNDDLLANGLVVEDNPGSSDENAANNHTALSAASESDAVILVVSMERANSNAAHWAQVRTTITQLFRDDSLHKAILVGTHADKFDIDEIMRDLDLTAEQDLYQKMCSARTRRGSLETSIADMDFEHADKSKHIKQCAFDIDKWKTQLTRLNQGTNIRGPQELHSTFGRIDRPLTAEKIRNHLRKLQQSVEQHTIRCDELKETLSSSQDELAESISTTDSLELEIKRRSFDARVKHVANGAADNFIKEVKEQEARLQKHVGEMLDKDQLPERLSAGELALLRQQTFPIMVASTAYLKPDDPETFVPREKTGIQELALRMKGINIVEQLAHLKALKNKIDAVMTTIESALSNDELEFSLASTALLSRQELSLKLGNLTGDFQAAVKTALATFEDAYKLGFRDRAPKLKRQSLKRASQRIDEYNNPANKPNRLKWQEYRALTAPARRGEWQGSRVCVNLNETVAGVIKMHSSELLKAIFAKSSGSPASLQALGALPECLTKMVQIMRNQHNEFKQFAQKVNLNETVLAALNKQIDTRKSIMQTLVDNAITELSKVYPSATNKVQNNVRTLYLPGYARAHAQRGKNARNIMAAKLRDSLVEDLTVSKAIDELDTRLRKKYTSLFNRLGDEVRGLAESIRVDYNQALQDHEAGFFKITDREIKKDIQRQLQALQGLKMSKEVAKDERLTASIKRQYESDSDDGEIYPSHYLSDLSDLSDQD